MDLPNSVKGHSILLVTYAINLTVIFDILLYPVIYIQSVNVFFWLSFKNIQNLSTSSTSTVTTLIKHHHVLPGLVKTSSLLTSPLSTSPSLHPHTEFISHTVVSAIIWKHVRSHPLLKLHSYFPPTQTENQSSFIDHLGPTPPDSSLCPHLLLFSFPFTVLQTVWPCCCSLKMGNILLSQGFCSHSSLNLEQS